ncbi:MAG: ComEC/Rec2 family competence protein [Acidobacteriota bacterium]
MLWVSGFTAPVVRAAAGFTFYLLARCFTGRVRPLNLLSGIAILYLAWDPLQLFEASFQLSFLSVAAIGAFAAPLLERMTGPLSRGARDLHSVSIDPHLDPRAAQLRVELRLAAETVQLWTRLPMRVMEWFLAGATRILLLAVDLTMVSLCVQIGLALPMAIYFHRISFTGLSANFLIVPLMNLLVPVGFGALFTKWKWLASFADMLLHWSAAIAQWHAVREPAWRVPDPPFWLAAALVATMLAGAMLMRRNLLRWPALAGVALLLALLIRSPWPAQASAGELELTAIDVGQGDSLLIVFPQGATMLIDGGGRLEYGVRRRPPNLDIGEDVVSTYLWSRGIRHIDVIVATHAHQDHTGGLHALIENFQPVEFWTGANPPPDLVAQARRQGARAIERRASEPFRFSGATVKFWHPPSITFPRIPATTIRWSFALLTAIVPSYLPATSSGRKKPGCWTPATPCPRTFSKSGTMAREPPPSRDFSMPSPLPLPSSRLGTKTRLDTPIQT